MNQFTILGAGPSGMLAAHAVHTARPDARISIVDHDPSAARSAALRAPGIVLVHEAIPGLDPIPSLKVVFRKRGSREAYAERLYGSPDAPCSWDRWETGVRPMYRLDRVLDQLWARYGRYVTDREMNPGALVALAGKFADDHTIISTIPAPVLCSDPLGCSFDGAETHVAHHRWYTEGLAQATTDLGIGSWDIESPDSVVYCGTSAPVNRISTIGRHEFEPPRVTLEASQPFHGSTPGIKPTVRRCYCPEKAVFEQTGRYDAFVRAGRFGEWRSGILLHEVYRDLAARFAE